MSEPLVAIPGLQRLRQDFNALARGSVSEIRKAEVLAASIVAEEAARLAPKGKRPLPPNRRRRLSETIRPLTRGTKIQVGATATQAPHANVNHWGGTIKPRPNQTITFSKEDPRRNFIYKAFDRVRPEFVNALADAFEGLAQRLGF